MNASVKVMRSYDYCHFEVALAMEAVDNDFSAVDALRKEAARLVDKAVAQYVTMKANVTRLENDEYSRNILKRDADYAEKTPESERTPEQKAQIKAYEDSLHRARRPRYDYEDDWDESEHDEPAEERDDQMF